MLRICYRIICNGCALQLLEYSTESHGINLTESLQQSINGLFSANNCRWFESMAVLNPAVLSGIVASMSYVRYSTYVHFLMTPVFSFGNPRNHGFSIKIPRPIFIRKILYRYYKKLISVGMSQKFSDNFCRIKGFSYLIFRKL